MNAFSRTILVALFLSFTSSLAMAQLPVSLELPRVSPFETRSITIGYTTIGFEYSSVGKKGREIWGGLIPYGQVWRIGANENTVFSVTDDVLINGNPLPAGTYGLHSIPGEESWTLIFSNFSEAWGSYFYDESEDQLRVEVIPEEMNSTYEWMKFSFENYTDTSVDMSMKWARLHAKTGDNEAALLMAEELVSEFPDEWRAYYGAALTHQDLEDIDTAIKLMEQAIELAPDNISNQLNSVLEGMRR